MSTERSPAGGRPTGRRTSRGVRAWLGQVLSRTSGKLALVFVVLAVLFGLALLSSPSRVYWTGRQVPAVVQGGLAYYRVGDTSYTIDVPSERVHDGPAKVSLDPAHPDQALVDYGVTKWVDGLPVIGCLVVAAGLLVVPPVWARVRASRRDPADAPQGPDGWLPDSLRSRYHD